MKKQNFLNDIVTVAGGVLKSFEEAKDYSKIKLKDKLAALIEDMNFMKKVEIEEIREMLIKSRIEIDELRKKLSNIEKKLNKKK